MPPSQNSQCTLRNDCQVPRSVTYCGRSDGNWPNATSCHSGISINPELIDAQGKSSSLSNVLGGRGTSVTRSPMRGIHLRVTLQLVRHRIDRWPRCTVQVYSLGGRREKAYTSEYHSRDHQRVPTDNAGPHKHLTHRMRCWGALLAFACSGRQALSSAS